MGDTVFTLGLWIIVLCAVFALTAFVADRIEAAGRE